MSGIAWIILNAALALAAVVGTVKVAKTPPPKPFSQAQLDENADKQEKDSDAPKAQQKNNGTPQPAAQHHPDELPRNASLDDLWKHTLFLPGRAEAEPGDADAEAAAQAAALAGKNFEFELVGIAQISPTDKNPVPIAILRSKESGAQRRRPMPQRGGQRGGTPQQPQQQEKETPQKQIFKEGDPLNNTGYVLKAIYPEQKMVEVSRGSETIKLYINYAGAEATQRREAITKAAAEKKEEAARQQSIRERQNQQQNQQQNAPRTPPAPPGMNSGQQNNGNQGNNRSQQIRNQVEQNVRARGGWQGNQNGQNGRGNWQNGQNGRGNWQNGQNGQNGRGNWQGNQNGRGNWQGRQGGQQNR